MRVRFGQMSDFAEAIFREKPELPVVSGDMPDTWIHGIGSMPIETKLAHATRPRIAALGSARHAPGPLGRAGRVRRRRRVATLTRTPSCSANTRGGQTFPDMPATVTARSGRRGWRRALSLPSGRIRPETRLRSQAAASVDADDSGHLPALAKAVNVSGRRIVVFNPLPWPRDGEVDVPWTGDCDRGDRCGDVKDRRRSGRQGPAAFRGQEPAAAGLPDLCAVRQQVRARLAATGRRRCDRIENQFLRVTLDPARCGIRSIVDKKTGRELVNLHRPTPWGSTFTSDSTPIRTPEFTRLPMSCRRTRAK